ncbi:acyl-CoA dehydrogenase family protein [Mycolicibacterium pyrenivorans]|uniref:acyl-CoA dehydrogenase family protein n=1 Tax=Mycolicibacterium pyrenivorans TaxID=187102 RepID=UPI0021F2B65A|nr:acyl-CoA dehydrogenase family protein [Mycolicibacterium pyrenivorans]MCV7153327.1 acyl-CoA/acyl-ACP dehydrogenase [Mycolicibacterium pyrenivorans]
MLIPDVVTEEHSELRATVRRLFETRSPEPVMRKVIETDAGYDSELWHQMADQVGLHGLGLPERYGGSGYGSEETTIVFEEIGRALVPSPFFATIALAARLLVELGDEDADDRYLPRIASGDLIATVAIAESAGSWQPRDLSEVAAVQHDGGWRLSGEKTTVLSAETAELLLAVVTDNHGTSVFAVDPADSGVTIVPLTTLDLAQRQSKVRFDHAPATLIGVHGGSAAAVASMLDHAALALAAEQAGSAAFLVEMCVDYAKLRHQFGQPIGAFQAIKHKLADMAFDVERMDSVVRHAATTAAADTSELAIVASIAKVFCSEAFFRVAAESIQIHGGIGFTWEHPAHLYFRRAKSSEYLLGSPGKYRDLLLEKIACRSDC